MCIIMIIEVCALSFSSRVKNELCRTEVTDKCCIMSELEAVVKTSGVVKKDKWSTHIQLVTENPAFARRAFSFIKSVFNANPEVSIRKSKKLKKHVLYSIAMLVNSSDENLTNLTCDEDKSTTNRLNNNCCTRAYLRGAFLAGGSVSDPEKTYHLEISNRSKIQAVKIKQLMKNFGLNSKVIKRKSGYITYLKEGENIADFLNIVYAHNALLEFENVRILKDMRNNVNRIVNCETANLDKTVNASLRQVEKINYIKSHIGFERLPKNLREIAELRLEYRDASLTELGQMLSPVLGKSGVNHRLRKLEKIAENIINVKGKP